MLTKTVGCRGLNTPACGWNETFDGSGVVGARELLVHGLCALYDGNSQQILVDVRVPVENLQNLRTCIFLGEMRSMAFLPEEFARSDEGHGICVV